MIGEQRMKIATILVLAFLMFCPGFNALCGAAEGPTAINKTPAEQLTLAVGESVIIDAKVPVRGVSIAGPDKPDEAVIVDAVVLPPKQVYVSGRSAGITYVTLLSNTNSVIAVYNVEVTPDVRSLKKKLHEVFPNEKDIRVTGTYDNITLSGTVSGTANMAQVVSLAQSYAPLGRDGKRKVVNLLEVGGVQQVMLEVRVSEMSKTLGRRLGVNFNMIGRGGREGNISLLSNFPVLGDISGLGTVFADYIRGDVTWTLLIDALKEKGMIKVLAEPTLIALSGKEAKFLAGGEFPVPVPDQDGRVTIEYKPFGVGLSFTPIVLSSGKISMQVAPEVSELDFDNAIALQGFIVPSLTTRRVATTIELADGQSFAIAGLIKEEMKESIRKFPLLGDLPVLGPLFRSSSFEKRDSELVVVVTPRLVKPVDMKKQTLPTDQFVDPNDFEFYLLGALEGSRPVTRSSGNPVATVPTNENALEGKFGHITPK